MKNSLLRRKLAPHGLDTATTLAKAIGRDLSQASKWLNGDRFSVGIAQSIAKAIGEKEWSVVYKWQKGANSDKSNRFRT